jgi:hypothetical protein
VVWNRRFRAVNSPIFKGLIGSPETSVSDHLTPRSNPEDARILYNRGWSLRCGRHIAFVFVITEMSGRQKLCFLSPYLVTEWVVNQLKACWFVPNTTFPVNLHTNLCAPARLLAGWPARCLLQTPEVGPCVAAYDAPPYVSLFRLDPVFPIFVIASGPGFGEMVGSLAAFVNLYHTKSRFSLISWPMYAACFLQRLGNCKPCRKPQVCIRFVCSM